MKSIYSYLSFSKLFLFFSFFLSFHLVEAKTLGLVTTASAPRVISRVVCSGPADPSGVFQPFTCMPGFSDCTRAGYTARTVPQKKSILVASASSTDCIDLPPPPPPTDYSAICATSSDPSECLLWCKWGMVGLCPGL